VASARRTDATVLSGRQLRRTLARLWLRNARIGWPERLRGLHYWLGWEYAALLNVMGLRRGSTVVDIGTGAHSIWPYLLAGLVGARVIATDIDRSLTNQLSRHRRVYDAGLAAPGMVQLVRADARRLPFPDQSADAVTAVSTIEHVRSSHGDRVAVQEIARVLRPGGRAWLTVPFRAAGSMIELDAELRHFQWHYSPDTLRSSLLGPSGLTERRRVLYGEHLPFYNLTRKIPSPLVWLVRPWATLLSACLLHPTDNEQHASASLLELERPRQDGRAS